MLHVFVADPCAITVGRLKFMMASAFVTLQGYGSDSSEDADNNDEDMNLHLKPLVTDSSSAPLSTTISVYSTPAVAIKVILNCQCVSRITVEQCVVRLLFAKSISVALLSSVLSRLTRSSAIALGPHSALACELMNNYMINPFEKACNRWITLRTLEVIGIATII